MKKNITKHLLMRIISLAFFISSFLVYFFFSFNGSSEMGFILLLSANLLLQMYPLPSQGPLFSLLWFAGYCIFLATVFLMRPAVPAFAAICCVYLLVYLCFRFRQRFRKARFLFCANNVMLFVRDFSHLFYTLLLVTAVSFIPLLWPLDGGCWAVALFSVFFCVLYFRAYSSRSLFVSATFEREIFAIARGEIRNIGRGTFINDSRMETIYANVVEYMEKEKPYLDPSYSIYDMAQHTGTNKTYISKVINIYSGRNFCQFLNWYRVRYASAYANDNPDVKVTELALMSGFNSNVSFNSAFKVFMGYSPGEYLQQISRLE